MVGVGVLSGKADAGRDTASRGNERDARRRPGRRDLNPAHACEGDIPALLETELANVEVESSILVGDGNPNRCHW